eukprot:4494788-Pleurochrysis_carterae.AAC.1
MASPLFFTATALQLTTSTTTAPAAAEPLTTCLPTPCTSGYSSAVPMATPPQTVDHLPSATGNT